MMYCKGSYCTKNGLDENICCYLCEEKAKCELEQKCTELKYKGDEFEHTDCIYFLKLKRVV
jgi:hypothetical protein